MQFTETYPELMAGLPMAERRRLEQQRRKAARRPENLGRKFYRALAASMAELGAGTFTPNDPGTETKVQRQKKLQRRLHSALRAVTLKAKHQGGVRENELARRMVQCASTHQGRT